MTDPDVLAEAKRLAEELQRKTEEERRRLEGDK